MVSSSDSTKSPRSSSNLAEFPIKGKVKERDQRWERGKKVVTSEDIPPRGPRNKKLQTSPPRTLSHFEQGSDDNKEESSLEEKCLDNVSMEEVDATSIDRKDPSLALIPAYNDRLSRPPNERIK